MSKKGISNYILNGIKIGLSVTCTKTGRSGYVSAHTIIDGKYMYTVTYEDGKSDEAKEFGEKSCFKIDKDKNDEYESINQKFMLGELVCIVRSIYDCDRLQFVGTIGIITHAYIDDSHNADYGITTEDGETVEGIWQEELQTYSGPFRNPYKKPSIKQDKKRRIEKITHSSDDSE